MNRRRTSSNFLLQASSKDFWVCWTLKELFGLPEWGERLTFKGGTSLSKGWGLIDRFSEDVDIVIDRHALGFGDERSPDKASSNKQAKKWLEALKEASQRCVNGRLLPLLRDSLRKEMFFGEVPEFEDIIQSVADFQKKFNMESV